MVYVYMYLQKKFMAQFLRDQGYGKYIFETCTFGDIDMANMCNHFY